MSKSSPKYQSAVSAVSQSGIYSSILLGDEMGLFFCAHID